MRDVLPFAAIALLLAANKNGSVKYKPPIKLTYDCFRGCNWKVGGDCWSRDYDWTVTAEFPALQQRRALSREDADIVISNLITSGVAVLNPVFTTEPNPDYDPDKICDYGWGKDKCRTGAQKEQMEAYWRTKNLTIYKYWTYNHLNYYGVTNDYWKATSLSWDYNNPQSFYAEQASAMITKAYDSLTAVAQSQPSVTVLPLQDYSVEVSYTKAFSECADKDAKLDMLVDFVKQYIIDYIVKQYIPVA